MGCTLSHKKSRFKGQPVVSDLKKIHIRADVEAQRRHDLEVEAGAIKAYNDGIRLCLELGDNYRRSSRFERGDS